MKVTVISNSSEAIKEAKRGCSSLYVSLGYVYGPSSDDTLNKDNSFAVKVLNFIDKGFSFFAPISKEEKEITREITAKYSEILDYVRKEEPRLSDKTHTLYIKNNSKLNQSLDNALFYNITDLFDKLKIGIQYFGSFAFRNFSKIHMETKDFTEEGISRSPFRDTLKESFSRNEITQFILLHEFSHTMEFVNRQIYQDLNGTNPIMSNLLTKLEPCSSQEFIKMANERLESSRILNSSINYEPNLSLIEEQPTPKNNDNYLSLDPSFCKELSDIPAEIYADVNSILIKRNLDIEKGIFDPEDFRKKIDTIIKARNEEYLYYSKHFNNPVNCFGHNSSQGMKTLKELDFLFESPGKKISLETIHNISEKAMNVGLSRTMIASAFSSQEAVGQFNTLFDMKFKRNMHFVDDYKKEPGFSYLDHMQEFRKQAGAEWVQEFEKNRDLVQSLPLDRDIKNTLIFLAELDVEIFQDRLDKTKKILAENGNVDFSNTANPKEQPFQMKLFSDTMRQVEKFREKVSDTSPKPSF